MSDIEEADCSDSIELIRLSDNNQSPPGYHGNNQSPCNNPVTPATATPDHPDHLDHLEMRRNSLEIRRKSDDSGFAVDSSVNRSDFSSSSDDGSHDDTRCRDDRCEVRLVRKCGRVNVGRTDDSIVTSLKRKLFSGDTFTTVVELSWGWHLLLFSSLFVVSWVFFGLVYLVLVTVHEGGECISTVTEGLNFVKTF